MDRVSSSGLQSEFIRSLDPAWQWVGFPGPPGASGLIISHFEWWSQQCLSDTHRVGQAETGVWGLTSGKVSPVPCTCSGDALFSEAHGDLPMILLALSKLICDNV